MKIYKVFKKQTVTGSAVLSKAGVSSVTGGSTNSIECH